MTQADALNILKMGNNVFLTGGAGAGKTFVLNTYIQYLKDHEIPVAITASTGIAATHIGGMTIHAWSGIGIRDIVSDYDIDQMESKKYLWDRYQSVQVLIIDEISMLGGGFLDILDRICRSMKRAPDKPFGGIQVVLCGDLFQLPPVSEEDYLVIDSLAWRTASFVICYLHEQHRQSDDDFTEILNAMRNNTVDESHTRNLMDRITDFDEETFSRITKLFTHNRSVDAMNLQALERIDTHPHEFIMTVRGKDRLVEGLKKSCLAPERLVLKEGAEVMFVKNNFDKGYVNGTRGIVTDFQDGLPVVTTRAGDDITVGLETWSVEDEGKVLASITQMPLRHAWAITVHKSQGMSLDEAVIDLSQTFTYGMGYVALSRVRTLAGLHLVGFADEALAMDPRMYLVDKNLQERSRKADERLLTISESELKERHEVFIKKTGGILEPRKGGEKHVRAHKKHFDTRKTHEISYELIKEGASIESVAKDRDLVIGTVIDHLDKARQIGLKIDFKHIKPSRDDIKIIKEAFQTTKEKGIDIHEAKLTPVKRYLDKAGHDYSFDMIKLVRLFLK